MPDVYLFTDEPQRPDNDPTCCPDAYLCLTDGRAEVECPRHGGFDVCCSNPGSHVQQDRQAWHRQMYSWEQRLLLELYKQSLATA